MQRLIGTWTCTKVDVSGFAVKPSTLGMGGYIVFYGDGTLKTVLNGEERTSTYNVSGSEITCTVYGMDVAGTYHADNDTITVQIDRYKLYFERDR